MKKILLFISCILFINGCTLSNTPTTITEDYLSKYQRMDDNITISYNEILDNNTNNKYKEEYKDLVIKQYKNLSYEIKDEEIDGRHATITVQIKVYDYKEIIDKYDKDNYEDESDYYKLISDRLNEQKDKIVYTIDIELNMNNNDTWEVIEIDRDTKQKLLGIY